MFSKCASLAGLLLTSALAQDTNLFDKTEVMIPARDGIKLHTVLFTPKNAKSALPVMLQRTPYGVPVDEKGLRGSLRYLAADGYVFAFQDIRGRFKSEGQFVMQRAVRDKRDLKSVDESTDAWDTIAWLTKNVKSNNGRVGMMGVSYGGWLVTMALLDPHPALKAASEQATPADMFLGDDFHHNGAFRLSYGFEYAALLETSKEENTNYGFNKADTYQWYLNLGVLSNVNEKYFYGKMPTWNDFTNHPDYDAFWRKQAFDSSISSAPKAPNLNVAGWWDQEDFYGPVRVYERFEKFDTQGLNYIVAGPWNHGGWRNLDGSSLGDVQFDSNTSKYFQRDIEAPWFAYWLKDKGDKNFAEATVFETGANRWERYDSWPPKSAAPTRIYMRSGGTLSFDAPTDGAEAFDSYVSDPAHPVPYRKRPISPTYPGGGWPTWLVEDQRFVDDRPDVLTWQTEPLTADVHVAGDIVAQLFASTSGTDSDWVVKLIDVYAEDYTETP